MPTRNLRALAATARLPNVPSVVSNVWLGVAIAIASHGRHPDRPTLVAAVTAAFAGTALYLAGNFFNDWADREWDASRRPERALPQGWFKPSSYLAIAVGSALLGLTAAAVLSQCSLIVALVIAAAIALYTWVHKRSAWAVIPLASCRALLPVLGWTAVNTGSHFTLPAVAGCACGLFAYVTGLSLSARNESRPTARPTPAWLLFPLTALIMAWTATRPLFLPVPAVLTGLLPFGLWLTLCFTYGRRPVARHVALLLAGLPLVDAIILLPLALMIIGSGGSIAVALGTGGLSVAAWLVGLCLQRLAPAT